MNQTFIWKKQVRFWSKPVFAWSNLSSKIWAVTFEQDNLSCNSLSGEIGMATLACILGLASFRHDPPVFKWISQRLMTGFCWEYFYWIVLNSNDSLIPNRIKITETLFKENAKYFRDGDFRRVLCPCMKLKVRFW